MKTTAFSILFAGALMGCKQEKPVLVRLNQSWLDSIKHKSDTAFIKQYRNGEFVTAEYFINRKDTTICQVMKDSAQRIRQVILTKSGRKLFGSEYFANGQQKASLPLDYAGKLHGLGKFYYESGSIKSEGAYLHGLYAGEWINYNKNGDAVSKDKFDSNGQLTATIQIK
jgi:antitoxin component YwqK of YwqJK toxin-antitoxin module